MKIRWRQQEMFFITVAFLILLTEYLLSWDQSFVQTAVFADAGIKYNFLRHSLGPFLLVFGMPLILLLLINGWIIPRYADHRHRIWILLISLVISWSILTVTYGLHYYIRFYYISSRIGEMAFRIDARKAGFSAGSILTILYSLYLGFRESIIHWLERTKEQQAFRIMVCNRITLTAFVYILLMIAMVSFGLMKSDGPAIAYLFILIPVIITCFINIYFLLPQQEIKGIPVYKNILKLSVAPFSLSFTAWIFYVLMSGNLKIVLLVGLFVIVMLVATPFSWLFYIQQREKINNLLDLEKRLGKTTADLAFLRSQINPHFLFNTLNTLYGTALNEQATRTASGIQRLGDMMRFLLHDNHRDSIPLIREVEYLQHYIALQSLRIAESPGVRIETSVNDARCDHSIAPMLLIPFVENAFKHGIRLTRPSYIIIKFYCDEKGVYLDVVNSRHPTNDPMNEEGYSGVGMENVKQRLELIYPNAYTLQVHEDDAAFQIHLFIRLDP